MTAFDNVADIRVPRQERPVVEIIYLGPGENMPDIGDDERWLRIDATTDGLFYGTGGAWKSNGEWVGYCSLTEDDVSLELALTAAKKWAARYNVSRIWVQKNPE